MTMRRPVRILLLILLAATTLGGASFFLGRHLCARHLARPTDDLDWLKIEFKINDADMARIRQLHEGYLPRCHFFCAQIAEKKEAMNAIIRSSGTVPADTEQRLADIAALRAQCQAAMLRHFVEVSKAMPPEQGRRYMAEMHRITLGAHEQVEASMSGPSCHAHP